MWIIHSGLPTGDLSSKIKCAICHLKKKKWIWITDIDTEDLASSHADSFGLIRPGFDSSFKAYF